MVLDQKALFWLRIMVCSYLVGQKDNVHLRLFLCVQVLRVAVVEPVNIQLYVKNLQLVTNR